MTTQDATSTVELKATFRSTAVWLWLSTVAALLAVTGSVIALSVESIYMLTIHRIAPLLAVIAMAVTIYLFAGRKL